MGLYNKIDIPIHYLVFLIIVSFCLLSGEEEPQSLPLELYVGLENSSNNITFSLTANGVVWAADEQGSECLISYEYNQSNLTVDYTLVNISSWEGWHFVTSRGLQNNYPVFAYGLYQLECEVDIGGILRLCYIYLDYRDDRYGGYENYGTPYGHPIDLWIKFDRSSGDFYYSSNGDLSWNEVQIGDTLLIWEIKQMGTPTRNLFQPTTPQNLTLSYVNNHPMLTWNLSEPKEAAIYEIYRKVCYGPPKYMNCDPWGIAGYTGTGDTTWIDNEFNTNGTESKAYYKVRAVSGDGNLYSPGWSNVVSTVPGTFTPYIKDRTEQIFEIVDPAPVNIYPNPFNSSIRFKIVAPGNDIRKIELYNLHGELLRMLEVNGTCMEVTWDGIDSQGGTLPSGVYLVVIKSGSRVIYQDKILYLK